MNVDQKFTLFFLVYKIKEKTILSMTMV